MTATPDGSHPVLLYDGTCGFCAESVQLVLRHDRRQTLRFAALQGAFGAAARARHPELGHVDSVVWLEPASASGPERVLVRSDAALRVATYLGGWFTLARVGRLVPRAVRDRAYDLIARHRHRLLAAGPSCLVPPAEVRARFLDPVS
ncbi:MAG TPA: DCC1-like thiol-disulfide oxidoreductase family protein [Gemmatimonadales bacterium]|nr:DCC1-like thiol-disulfide oxidoreductase family protein [Gemmatimonadales bacterium]